jgi:hypothetical protein
MSKCYKPHAAPESVALPRRMLSRKGLVLKADFPKVEMPHFSGVGEPRL